LLFFAALLLFPAAAARPMSAAAVIEKRADALEWHPVSEEKHYGSGGTLFI
jgi:hypothetical protein